MTGLGQVMTMSTQIGMSALGYTQPESCQSGIGPEAADPRRAAKRPLAGTNSTTSHHPFTACYDDVDIVDQRAPAVDQARLPDLQGVDAVGSDDLDRCRLPDRGGRVESTNRAAVPPNLELVGVAVRAVDPG